MRSCIARDLATRVDVRITYHGTLSADGQDAKLTAYLLLAHCVSS